MQSAYDRLSEIRKIAKVLGISDAWSEIEYALLKVIADTFVDGQLEMKRRAIDIICTMSETESANGNKDRGDFALNICDSLRDTLLVFMAKGRPSSPEHDTALEYLCKLIYNTAA